ncbi:hypothetical protein PMKS-001544 [Pichia membranifaciens]|uniref:Protein transport protein SEC31 n=1 Tax=Pichia membranifaciens TaxID=4926 RepID=A0A1Q2YEU0_9ASCO|nr:hypothetical protein PMKS-001544 [Pichia membranifaciens]
MVKLHEIDETAIFAWSNDALPLIATGTLSGVMDDTFSSDSSLSIYDPFAASATKQPAPVYTAAAPGKFASIDWSKPADGHARGVLACGLENSSIQLYDPAKILSQKPTNLVDTRIAEYTKHTTPVLQVKFNPLQSHILASSGSKGEIFIWDVKKGTSFNPGQAISPMSKVSSLAWNNNMAHIFGTAGDNGYTSIWDLKAKREVLQLNYSNTNLSVIRWHPSQSTKLVTASDSDSEPVILTWDLRNSSVPEKVLKGHKKGILSLDWCLSDPNLLLSSGKDDSTLLWNPIEGVQLATYPSLSNWVHETRFAPKIPEVFASASLAKKICIQSLQDTSEPISTKVQSKDENDFWNEISTTETQQPLFKVQQAPIWLKRPVSATFGYGGKLVISKKEEVKIVTVSNNGFIDKSAKEMITAISTKDFSNLCDSKVSSGTNLNLKESSDWSLLKHILTDDSLESLLKIEPSSPADTSRSDSTDLIDDDDFFAQIGDSKKKSDFSAATASYTPEGKFDLFPKSSDGFEKDAVTLLLSNKTDELLDLCIEKDHILEALIIALNGSQEAKDKAKSAYFRKYAKGSSFARLLYSSSNSSIGDIVKNADISSWTQIAKSIIIFSKGKPSFNVEMKLLGDRLLDSTLENSRDSALSCYIAADALDKVSKVWLSELRDYENFFLETKNDDGSKNTAFEARFKALGEVIEKIVVFQSKTSSPLSGDLSELGKAFVEYADSLVNFGHYELAYKLLGLVSDSIPEIRFEKERISKAFINNVTTNTATTRSASKYAVPVTQQQQQQPLQPAKSISSSTPVDSAARPKRAKNPYVFPEAISAPVQSNNPYQPNNIYSGVPSNSTPLGQNVNLAAPYQPVNGASTVPMNGISNNTARVNPYAPPTALDSLKNPHSFANPNNNVPDYATPPPFKKENVVPPSLRKDVGGWNDLPTHLAPVIKPSAPSSNANAYRPAVSRSVSQAPAIPPPPARNPSGPVDSPPAATPATSRMPSFPKNPYAPKPSVAEPLAPSLYPKSPFAPQQPPLAGASSAPVANPPKNPYAPKPSTNNAYVPESTYSPQPPLQQSFQNQQIPNTNFNAKTMPPPPAYAKPVSANIVTPPPPPPKKLNSPGNVPPPPAVSATSAAPSAQISPEAEPIVSILSAELEKVRPNIPAKFSKHLVDAEKRLNILFDHLKKGDLITPPTVEKLVSLSTALNEGQFAKAAALRDEILDAHANECGDWMVGVNRLIGMVKATSQ